MTKHTSPGRTRQAAARGWVHDVSVEGWPTDERTTHALDDPDVGVAASAFYRWRRNKSEPPPPLGPTGSGLAHYRRRDP